MSRMGKTCIVFLEPGAKVNSEYHCQHVTCKVVVYYLTSVQDASATPGPCSRTAHRRTLTYLRRENVTFIEPDTWLPNSPDLNPVD